MIWRNLFIYSVFLRFGCNNFILFYFLYDLFSFGMFHCNTSLCWLNCLFHNDKFFSCNSLVFCHCLFLCFRVMIQLLAFQNLLITWHYWPPGHQFLLYTSYRQCVNLSVWCSISQLFQHSRAVSAFWSGYEGLFSFLWLPLNLQIPKLLWGIHNLCFFFFTFGQQQLIVCSPLIIIVSPFLF